MTDAEAEAEAVTRARVERVAQWLFERTLGCNPRAVIFDQHPWSRATETARRHYRDLARALLVFVAALTEEGA